jgi:hypothetical protein
VSITYLGLTNNCRDNSEGVKSFLEKRPAKFSGTMDNTNVTGYPWWMPIDTLGRAKVDPSGKPKM